ncbi:hypothetical protein CC80DRAFT_412235, partial [Byssothecium circinans]
HMISYKDGRFTYYLRFHFIAFNTLLRRQTTAKVGFFVRKTLDGASITAEDIQAQFNSADGGQSLINAVV